MDVPYFQALIHFFKFPLLIFITMVIVLVNMIPIRHITIFDAQCFIAMFINNTKIAVVQVRNFPQLIVIAIGLP